MTTSPFSQAVLRRPRFCGKLNPEELVIPPEAHQKEIQSALKDLGAKVTDTEIQIKLSGDVLFDFDEWDNRPDAEESLKKAAKN